MHLVVPVPLLMPVSKKNLRRKSILLFEGIWKSGEGGGGGGSRADYMRYLESCSCPYHVIPDERS